MATKELPTLNLDDLIASDKATLKIKHPKTGEDTSGHFTVHGAASATYQKHRIAMLEERMKLEKVTPEQSHEMGLTLLANILEDMGGFTYKGKPYVHSFQNAKEVLSNPGYYWLKDQIDEGVVNVGNFLKG